MSNIEAQAEGGDVTKRQGQKTPKRVPLSRRGFLQGFGAGSGLLVLAGCGGGSGPGGGGGGGGVVAFENTLVGTIEDGTMRDYSPVTGEERQAIPSACWQCVARDGIVCQVEDGRLVTIEGNPLLRRTNGKLCSRGNGGVGQVYDPDRLLFPMRRVPGTARGDHQWERISWADALDELATKLREPLTLGQPERFMFHYGRMKASSSTLVKSYFLPAYGTKTYAGHTGICESAKWTAQELVWGKHYDVNDVENSRVILNFGCNPLEAHTNHLPLSQRITKALRDNNTPLYTFDVRLSNTAAKSTGWVPIMPGTDLAVVLAMANHIVTSGLVPPAGADFINTWSDLDTEGGTFATRMDKLRYMLEQPRAYLNDVLGADAQVPALWDPNDQPVGGYTPLWAESISGVPAATIRELAALYAANSPGSTIMSYRGAVMHANGVNTERAVLMLEALCGNIDVPGGRVHGVGAKWSYSSTYGKPSNSVSGLSVQNDGAYIAPTHHASHQVLSEIKRAHDEGRPEDAPLVYMVYCYTPAYANGDIQQNIDILKNETYLPYIVVSDTAYTEAAMYADLLLPDTTYLERWDYEDMVSMNHIPEWYIRQPVVAPLGQTEDLKDTLIKVAARLTGDAPEMAKVAAIGSMKNFVEAACKDTAIVDAAGRAKGYADGFEFMKAEGAYWDPAAASKYQAYLDPVSLTLTDPATILDADPADYVFKDAEGICWEGTKAEFNAGYRGTKSSYKHYKGQEVAGSLYLGFKPDKANKSGRFELETPLLSAKHYPAMPIWHPVPEHGALAADELVMTHFKVTQQTHSRTANCKVLTELAHNNPAWINPVTAAGLNLQDGDLATLTRTIPLFNDSTYDPAQARGTTVSAMDVEVRVTEAVHPRVIAISHSLGHWAYGRYASGNATPVAGDPEQASHIASDPDTTLKWWTKYGFRPNWIMPNAGEPISGALRYNDVVVRVQKK